MPYQLESHHFQRHNLDYIDLSKYQLYKSSKGLSANKREKILHELGLFTYFLLKKIEPEENQKELFNDFYQDRQDDVFKQKECKGYQANFKSYVDKVD